MNFPNSCHHLENLNWYIDILFPHRNKFVTTSMILFFGVFSVLYISFFYGCVVNRLLTAENFLAYLKPEGGKQ